MYAKAQSARFSQADTSSDQADSSLIRADSTLMLAEHVQPVLFSLNQIPISLAELFFRRPSLP